MPDKRDKLYQNLISMGLTTKELGTQDEFKAFVTDESKVRKVYQNLKNDGAFGDDFEDTEDQWADFVRSDFEQVQQSPNNTASVKKQPQVQTPQLNTSLTDNFNENFSANARQIWDDTLKHKADVQRIRDYHNGIQDVFSKNVVDADGNLIDPMQRYGNGVYGNEVIKQTAEKRRNLYEKDMMDAMYRGISHGMDDKDIASQVASAYKKYTGVDFTPEQVLADFNKTGRMQQALNNREAAAQIKGSSAQQLEAIYADKNTYNKARQPRVQKAFDEWVAANAIHTNYRDGKPVEYTIKGEDGTPQTVKAEDLANDQLNYLSRMYDNSMREGQRLLMRGYEPKDAAEHVAYNLRRLGIEKQNSKLTEELEKEFTESLNFGNIKEAIAANAQKARNALIKGYNQPEEEVMNMSDKDVLEWYQNTLDREELDSQMLQDPDSPFVLPSEDSGSANFSLDPHKTYKFYAANDIAPLYKKIKEQLQKQSAENMVQQFDMDGNAYYTEDHSIDNPDNIKKLIKEEIMANKDWYKNRWGKQLNDYMAQDGNKYYFDVFKSTDQMLDLLLRQVDGYVNRQEAIAAAPTTDFEYAMRGIEDSFPGHMLQWAMGNTSSEIQAKKEGTEMYRQGKIGVENGNVVYDDKGRKEWRPSWGANFGRGMLQFFPDAITSMPIGGAGAAIIDKLSITAFTKGFAKFLTATRGIKAAQASRYASFITNTTLGSAGFELSAARNILMTANNFSIFSAVNSAGMQLATYGNISGKQLFWDAYKGGYGSFVPGTLGINATVMQNAYPTKNLLWNAVRSIMSEGLSFGAGDVLNKAVYNEWEEGETVGDVLANSFAFVISTKLTHAGQMLSKRNLAQMSKNRYEADILNSSFGVQRLREAVKNNNRAERKEAIKDIVNDKDLSWTQKYQFLYSFTGHKEIFIDDKLFRMPPAVKFEKTDYGLLFRDKNGFVVDRLFKGEKGYNERAEMYLQGIAAHNTVETKRLASTMAIADTMHELINAYKITEGDKNMEADCQKIIDNIINKLDAQEKAKSEGKKITPDMELEGVEVDIAEMLDRNTKEREKQLINEHEDGKDVYFFGDAGVVTYDMLRTGDIEDNVARLDRIAKGEEGAVNENSDIDNVSVTGTNGEQIHSENPTARTLNIGDESPTSWQDRNGALHEGKATIEDISYSEDGAKTYTLRVEDNEGNENFITVPEENIFDWGFKVPEQKVVETNSKSAGAVVEPPIAYETGKELNAVWQDGKGTIIIKDGRTPDGKYNVIKYDETTGETVTDTLSASEINSIVTDEPTVIPETTIKSQVNGMVGRSLSEEESKSLISYMEANVEDAPVIELNEDTWEEQFPEGKVSTPLGEAKFGENQLAKMFLKNRQGEFGMLKPTLENPDVIIEEPSTAENAERNSSYLFVKTFNYGGKKYKFYTSVTVQKDGMEVVISNHISGRNAIIKKMQDGKILHLNDKLSSNSSDNHLAENQTGLSDLLPTQEESVISGGKGSDNSANAQENIENSSINGEKINAPIERTAAQKEYDAIAAEHEGVSDTNEKAKRIGADIRATITDLDNRIAKVQQAATAPVSRLDSQAMAKRDQARQQLAQLQQAKDYWNEVLAEHNAQLVKQQKEIEEKAKDDEFEKRKAEAEAKRKAEKEAAILAAAEGATPIEKKWNNAPKHVGRKKTINLPDGSTLTGHYVLTQSGAATASHDPFRNYASSEGFPTDEAGNNVNDRDYQGDATQRKETELQAAQYDGRAIDDIPVVSKRGIVYSGNGRTMAGDIAAKNNTDAAYVKQLREDADMYGFTPEQVAEMGEHPRLLFVPDEELPYTTATFAKFNVKASKGQGNVAKAVKASKQLSEQDVQSIVGIMAGVDGEGGYANIDSFFNSEKGTNDLILALQERGILQSNEIADYVENGKFNNAGKDYVKNLLLGTMFDADAIKVISEVPSVKNALVSAMNPLLENTRLGDYSTKNEVSNAARLIAEAKGKGFNSVADYMRQTSLFGQGADQFTEFEKALALAMDGGVENFRNALSEYNKTAAMEKEGSIFGAMTPDEVKAAFIADQQKKAAASNNTEGDTLDNKGKFAAKNSAAEAKRIKNLSPQELTDEVDKLLVGKPLADNQLADNSLLFESFEARGGEIDRVNGVITKYPIGTEQNPCGIHLKASADLTTESISARRDQVDGIVSNITKDKYRLISTKEELDTAAWDANDREVAEDLHAAWVQGAKGYYNDKTKLVYLFPNAMESVQEVKIVTNHEKSHEAEDVLNLNTIHTAKLIEKLMPEDYENAKYIIENDSLYEGLGDIGRADEIVSHTFDTYLAEGRTPEVSGEGAEELLNTFNQIKNYIYEQRSDKRSIEKRLNDNEQGTVRTTPQGLGGTGRAIQKEKSSVPGTAGGEEKTGKFSSGRTPRYEVGENPRDYARRVAEANADARFNETLQGIEDGTIKNRRLSLGNAGEALQKSGLPSAEIVMDYDRLKKKCIIRKTKCSHFFERIVLFPKTKRSSRGFLELSPTTVFRGCSNAILTAF